MYKCKNNKKLRDTSHPTKSPQIPQKGWNLGALVGANIFRHLGYYICNLDLENILEYIKYHKISESRILLEKYPQINKFLIIKLFFLQYGPSPCSWEHAYIAMPLYFVCNPRNLSQTDHDQVIYINSASCKSFSAWHDSCSASSKETPDVTTSSWL